MSHGLRGSMNRPVTGPRTLWTPRRDGLGRRHQPCGQETDKSWRAATNRALPRCRRWPPIGCMEAIPAALASPWHPRLRRSAPAPGAESPASPRCVPRSRRRARPAWWADETRPPATASHRSPPPWMFSTRRSAAVPPRPCHRSARSESRRRERAPRAATGTSDRRGKPGRGPRWRF